MNTSEIIRHSLEAGNMGMQYELVRLGTFYGVKFLNIVERVDLARSNLYIKNYDFDNPICYKCNMPVPNGCYEMPKEHLCFPQQAYKKNVPISSPYYGDNLFDQIHWDELQQPEMRLATFRNWSYTNNTEMKYKVAELANAGFFYNRKPFGVQCFYCHQRITVYVCETTNCFDFQLPKPTSTTDAVVCYHKKRLQYLIDRLGRRSGLGLKSDKPRKCLLCTNYKRNLAFRPFYESCYDCNQNLKALLSPSLPSYKVNFNSR